MLTDGEILRNYIDNQHKTKISIANDLGITKQTLFQYFKSGVLSEDNRRRFETYFGESIFTQERQKYSYIEKRRGIKNNFSNAIPVYEAEPVTLTTTVSYRDQNPPPDGPDFWVTIPQLRDCNYGCRAKGDSMHPLIRTNALVIGKEITDLSVVVFGEVYIVKTKNGIETVKYIHPVDGKKDMLLLVPYNEKAKTTPIHKSDIIKLYEAKAVFNTL